MKNIPLQEMEMYPPFEGFPEQGIDFFRKLKRNNTRAWFEKHKHEYEEYVKFPMSCLLSSLQPHFIQFAPEFDLNPKKSIFRIYRDVRFSSDKTLYKTHVAAHIVLGGKPKGFVGSGFYLQVEPGECYVGGGIYIPDGDQLKKIRVALAQHGEKFLGIVEKPKFKKMFAPFEWQKLQRVPKGFSDTHPMAEWLKYKQFFVGVSLPESKCYKETFVNEIASICKDISPLVNFLNNALTTQF